MASPAKFLAEQSSRGAEAHSVFQIGKAAVEATVDSAAEGNLHQAPIGYHYPRWPHPPGLVAHLIQEVPLKEKGVPIAPLQPLRVGCPYHRFWLTPRLQRLHS